MPWSRAPYSIRATKSSVPTARQAELGGTTEAESGGGLSPAEKKMSFRARVLLSFLLRHFFKSLTNAVQLTLGLLARHLAETVISRDHSFILWKKEEPAETVVHILLQ